MNVIKNCHLCQDNKEAIYELKDSVQPPKDLYYEGIGQLTAAFWQILKVSGKSPDRNICGECHNALRRIYYFFEQCFRAEGQLYEAYKEIKQEPEIEINSILTVDYDTQNPIDEIQHDADQEDRNTNIVTAFEDVFVNKDHDLAQNMQFDDEAHKPRRGQETLECKTNDCKICGQKYTSPNSLWKHQKIHQDVTYKCRKSPADFHYNQNRQVHEKRHRTSSSDCVCDVCGTMFSTSLRMMQHKSMSHPHEENKSSSTKLYQESKVYQTYESCLEEIQSDYKPYECEICGRRYASTCSMRKHKKIHDRINYKCMKCPAVLNCMQNLKVHWEQHKTSSLEFACDICGWMFPTISSMEQHKSKSHTGCYKKCCINEAKQNKMKS